MNGEYEIIIVPRETANDVTVMLVEWLTEDGAKVAAGDGLCVVESSKAAVEIPACRDGWVFHLAKAGDEIPVGGELAVISSTPEKPDIKKAVEPVTAEGEMKITRKAQLLMMEHDLSPDDFSDKGISILRERHVQELLSQKSAAGAVASAGGRFEKASHVQARTAKVLAESKATIPHSYLVTHIDAEATDVIVMETGHEHDASISISDRLVWCVSQTMREFPKANAAWRGDGVFYYDEVNVGFAMNMANGELVVPVLRGADKLNIVEIAGEIRGMQKKAIRHKLTPADLTGGTVTVTTMAGTGINQVYPIIYPGQSAIVSIGDRWGEDGEKYYSLALAFDHRVLNGTEAGEFLAAVAARMIRHE